MDLLFLGTSSGTPTRSRNVSGLALIEETGKRWYLIDCGEATQHQLLRTPLSLHGLTAIFITHVHGDHCYGLPGLLASAGMSGRREPLDIIAPAGIENWILATLRMSHTHLPFELRFHATEQLAEWRNVSLYVERVELSHRVPCFGYSFTETRPDPKLDVDKLVRSGVPRGPIWGELARGKDAVLDGRRLRSEEYLTFGRPPRRIVVGGDNDQPELLSDLCRSADVLVHEATYTQDIAARGKAHFGHSTAISVASFAEAMTIPNLLLTHFSARYQANPERSPSTEDLRCEASSVYGGRLFLAEDLARYRLGRDGRVEQLAGPPA